MPTPEIATLHLGAQRRIDGLVRPLPADDLARPVAACPGWTVHGVVSHLVGTVDWAAAGAAAACPPTRTPPIRSPSGPTTRGRARRGGPLPAQRGRHRRVTSAELS